MNAPHGRRRQPEITSTHEVFHFRGFFGRSGCRRFMHLTRRGAGIAVAVGIIVGGGLTGCSSNDDVANSADDHTSVASATQSQAHSTSNARAPQPSTGAPQDNPHPSLDTTTTSHHSGVANGANQQQQGGTHGNHAASPRTGQNGESTPRGGNSAAGGATTPTSPGRTVFQSPSGNIVCQFRGMDDDGCDVHQHPRWGDENRCPYLGVEARNDTMIGFRRGPDVEPCHWLMQGDFPRTGPVLPYGQSKTIPVQGNYTTTYTCTSKARGMTCTSAEGHGFFVNDKQYKTW
ncbi:hypothetical protein [uncultured Corynebacterium sp.]|uniref:hypothetical protein n=1 Tax=uncultured Corynebacterium sp. TaxID=159447 RepID=UPI0025EF27B9|nr:hypothetical protein [uncultured Corynebacterium sp.]